MARKRKDNSKIGAPVLHCLNLKCCRCGRRSDGDLHRRACGLRSATGSPFLQSSQTKPKRRRQNKGMCFEDRPVLEPNAAGIEVGAREMFVAVPPGRDKKPVRVFATFIEDLECLADWLSQYGVTTVALESSGVYWISLFEILELVKLERGMPTPSGLGLRTSRTTVTRSNAWRPSPGTNALSARPTRKT